MNRLARIRQDLVLNARGWLARRRLHAETVADLVGTVNELRQRVTELEVDLDELRADSRRVAELRIQVEDMLGGRA
ncbi:hypothetical protein [Microbacterium sp. NPDC058345]|uniref:hypothetical protein n=1 Tax=Microbacterium sp. NPDC058345 TaxID=3346455 RepID=UPI003667ECA6